MEFLDGGIKISAGKTTETRRGKLLNSNLAGKQQDTNEIPEDFFKGKILIIPEIIKILNIIMF